MSDAEQSGDAANAIDLEAGFRLRDVSVWPRRELVVRDGEEIHLEPKVMQVLVELARRQQTPVSRDELLETVWSDAVVGDEVLSRAVSLLRTSLGDERTNPRFIRTIPRQGYELVVPARRLSSKKVPRKLRPWLVGGIAAALAVVLIGVFIVSSSRAQPSRLAILAVQAESSELGPVAEGLVDEIINLASSSETVETVAKRSTFAFRDPNIQLDSVANALDADHILEGSLEQAGDVLQASIHLVETDSQSIVWTAQFSGASAEKLADEVLAGVQSALNDRLEAGISTVPDRETGPSPEAYRVYLAARHQWSLRGENRIQRSIQLLREAIALEPEFAEAYLALAHALAIEPSYSDNDLETYFGLARVELGKAVDLDPLLANDARTLEGFIQFRLRNWDRADALFRDALGQNPDNVLANYWYGMMLSTLGRYAEAMTYTRRAAELDPLSSVLTDRLAIAYLWLGELEEARRYFDAAAELGYIVGQQSKAYVLYLIRSGQWDALVKNLTAQGLPNAWAEAWVAGIRDPALRESAIAATREVIATRRLPYTLQFGVWVMLGETDAAFDSFDAGLKTVDIEFLWVAETAFIRESPRFDELLRQLNIPAD